MAPCSAYTPRACYPYYSMALRPGPSYKRTGINWILSMYGANDASCTSAGTTSCPTMKFCIVPACSTSRTSSVSEDRVFSGHFARLRSDVPANQILQICTKTRDGKRPSQEWRRACGRPSTTWTHQICRDTGVTATEALQIAEDRPFWRTIITAGGSGWTLRVTMMMMMMMMALTSAKSCEIRSEFEVIAGQGHQR